MGKRVLIVDLNNFAHYPSIAIGYLTSVLRSNDYHVELLAPFSTGLTGVQRERRSPWWGRFDLELRYRAAVSRNRLLGYLRARYRAFCASKLGRSRNEFVKEFRLRLDDGPDVVLVSTYLMYHTHCAEIAKLCGDRNIPLILGGPYFSAVDVAQQWIDIPGVTALVGGEVEPDLCRIVDHVVAGKSVCDIDGVWSKSDNKISLNAPPLKNLDSVPFPDYSQFPWSKYPNKIIPIITGRGCGWGVCSFCSDITSTAGRTYRSRSAKNVLDEIAYQHNRHGARMFVFTDLKLNSDLDVWHAIIRKMQAIVPGARWLGAVHVGTHGDNGLSLDELQRARAAGMVRLTTGLESGSQRILNKMVKGTDPDVTSKFLVNANAADISVRTTMIIGYPGEEATDVDETTLFLKKHENCIERVSLNRFQIMSGTLFAQQLRRTPGKFPTVTGVSSNHLQAQIRHHYTPVRNRRYRRAISRLLRVVHRINRRPLRHAASAFDGVM